MASPQASPFSSIPDAVDAIRRGEIVVVVDDPDRENEGDFVMAADRVTPEGVNFMISHGCGLLCTPMDAVLVADIGLQQMVAPVENTEGTAFTVSVDLAECSTGISAHERAATIRRLVAPDARRDDFRMPGHVFPLRARPGGVLERAGHTEAACDLARLAGLTPAGVICEIVNDDGTMARLPDLVEIARRHRLHLITIEDLVAFRRAAEGSTRRASSILPTPFGSFASHCYSSEADGLEHLALVLGRPKDGAAVAIHGECLAGDVFGSLGCGCGMRLRESMRRIAVEGAGVVVYLRRGEGRVLGFGHANDPRGADARDGDAVHGSASDGAAAAAILLDVGVGRIRLLDGGCVLADELTKYGLDVTEEVQLGEVPAGRAGLA